MNKSKRVGKIIYDYLVLEKLIKNKRSLYRVKCTICGNEKFTYNLKESCMLHGEISCKETYTKSFLNNVYGDFTVINSYHSGRLFFDLKCNICGQIIYKVEKRNVLEKNSNSHGIYCISNNPIYDKKLINKICRTFSNCKTRIKKGNEGELKYKYYKDMEFGFNSSLELIYDIYSNLEQMSKIFPLSELSIDRIDNTKGYIKGNVRFATKKTQNCNRRNSYTYYVDDLTFISSIDLGEYLGVNERFISRQFTNSNSNEFIYNNKTIIREKVYDV